MVNLKRIIYSIAYYWHGIPVNAIASLIWLFDNLYNLEWFNWSKVNNLPFNQTIADKIDQMIVDSDLRLTNRWINRFGRIGLEPVFRDTSPKIYKPSERFNEDLRLIIANFLKNKKLFKVFYLEHENSPINAKNFYTEQLDTIRLEARTSKIAQ